MYMRIFIFHWQPMEVECGNDLGFVEYDFQNTLIVNYETYQNDNNVNSTLLKIVNMFMKIYVLLPQC